jgi:hypothetical protein
MPAPPLANNFDGGTDGVNITTSDVGSGDAFSAVTPGGDDTIKYTTDQAHSNGLSAEIVRGATIRACYYEWTGLGNITTSVYHRQYVYLPALPGGAENLFITNVRTSAGTVAFLRINADGTISDLNSASSVISTSTTVVPTGQWFRLEWRVLAHASAGQSEWKLFSAISPGDGADGITPTETANNSGLNTGASIDVWRFSAGTSADTVTTFTYYQDDIAISSTGWLGPSTPPLITQAWTPREIPAKSFGPF